MPFNNYGLAYAGSAIIGKSVTPPNYMEFGIGSSDNDFTKKHLDDGILRNSITWSKINSTDFKGRSFLRVTDAIGSTIGEVGVGLGPEVGSNIIIRELSAIGDKTSVDSFSVEFDLKPRRR